MTAPRIVDPSAALGQALADASPDLMRHLLGTVINSLLSAEADRSDVDDLPARYPRGSKAPCPVCGRVVGVAGTLIAPHEVRKDGLCAGSRVAPDSTTVIVDPVTAATLGVPPARRNAVRVAVTRALAADRKQAELDGAAAARAGDAQWKAPTSATDRSGTSSVRSVSGGLPTLGKG